VPVDKKTKAFLKWLREGYEKGYCSDLYCENHDGTHRDDMKEYESYLNDNDGRDFCWAVVHIKEPYGMNG
tara:strand:+ start:186 stop:395 length:210 start_codon:yes stop_codon:yes gene_type:complete